MARDGSGNYTLPAGNPVVTGTTIDASWANDTMNDLATEIQDSLSRSGKGGMLVAFEFSDGTVGAPGQTWASETSSGMYRAGTNDVRYSIAGVDRLQIRANAADPVRFWNSSEGAWKNPLNEGGAYTVTGAWTFTGGVTFTTSNIVAGTIDADFGAVTATSYGGITEANLVDKTASETITGATWDFQAVTAVSYGGITEANLVDKSAAETVSGAWVFTGVATLDAPVTTADFGTGGRVKDGTDTEQPVGFNVIPLYEIDAADSFDLAHNGMLWHKDAGAAATFTCDNDGDIPVGATYIVVNEDTEDVTIAQGAGVTIRHMDGGGVTPPTGNLTLAEAGVATVYKYSDTEFWVWGIGLS